MKDTLHRVSISSPSGEGGEDIIDQYVFSLSPEEFPYVLLQAKAVSISFHTCEVWDSLGKVSISSPSGEGGE